MLAAAASVARPSPARLFVHYPSIPGNRCRFLDGPVVPQVRGPGPYFLLNGAKQRLMYVGDPL